MSKDLFSGHSKQYAAFRPTYPQELYEFILTHVTEKNSAWDCATGNGQIAKDLSNYFTQVYATDHSSNQLESAFKRENIFYSQQPAERTSFKDQQFDLITVGQALHWFNIPEFFSEARRVSKRGGIIAVWGYSLISIDATIDPVLDHFYSSIIGSYWDAERKLIDDHYATISFPFERIESPSFDFSFSWTLEELRGYLTTWSAVQKYVKKISQIL